MDWRLAESLKHLREQVNTRFPDRSRASDGSIGDAEHATRNSDHNPWVKDDKGQPVVTAIDITHDPIHGFDSYAFADMLMKNRDPRIKYVISNRRIGSGNGGPSPWTWRKYNGSSPHDHHVHISVVDVQSRYDDAGNWRIDNFAVGPETIDRYVAPSRPTIKEGSTGEDVKYLQNKLTVPLTGEFDRLTKYAVLVFQLRHKIVDDGIVGPQTWKLIG